MTSGIVDLDNGVERERLHWSLEVGGRTHTIDILPAAVRGSVAIELDGRVVRRMPKPKPQRPWQETALEIDGQALVVAVIWHHPVLRTEVFVDGCSVRGDRTIDDARQETPSPRTDYETWIGGLFGNEIPRRRALLPRRLGLVALVAIVVPVVLLVALPRPMEAPVRLALAAVAFVAYVIVLLTWLRSWRVVAERAHLHLLRRPELGDTGRLVRFLAAFVGYGLVSLAALGIVLATLAFAGG